MKLNPASDRKQNRQIQIFRFLKLLCFGLVLIALLLFIPLFAARKKSADLYEIGTSKHKPSQAISIAGDQLQNYKIRLFSAAIVLTVLGFSFSVIQNKKEAVYYGDNLSIK